MRHFKGLIPFCPFLLFASCVWADDIADRVSIDRVIAALNEVPVSPQLFTTDASSELGRLPKVSARNLRPQGAVPQRAGGPTVVISHEPWGKRPSIPEAAALLHHKWQSSIPALRIAPLASSRRMSPLWMGPGFIEAQREQGKRSRYFS